MKIIGHMAQIQKLCTLAQSQKVPQTFLFAGLYGIGKRLVADYFAKALLCSESEKPCGECSNCLACASGRFADYIVLEADENGKIRVGSPDDKGSVRWFVHRLTEKSAYGKYIAIIDGLDLISEVGQNILLKTIEEPGSGVTIIQTTASKSKVLPTILSRSLCLDFFPLTYPEVVQILDFAVKHHSIEDVAIIASGGSVSIARDLIEKELMPSIIQVAGTIKESILNNSPFIETLTEFEKISPLYTLYDLIINLFRFNMKNLLQKELQYNQFLEKLYIDDYTVLHTLLKKILELKSDSRFNTNLKYAAKSAIYQLQDRN